MSSRSVDDGVLSGVLASAELADGKSADAKIVAAVSGKPYSWQLPTPENPEMVAIPPTVLIERAFMRSAAFRKVLEQAAAFFVVVSRNNGYEGRDPLVVSDDVRCGTVSTFLDVDIDLLGRALLEMQRRGLVSPCKDGTLHIDDFDALNALSEGGSATA